MNFVGIITLTATSYITTYPQKNNLSQTIYKKTQQKTLKNNNKQDKPWPGLNTMNSAKHEHKWNGIPSSYMDRFLLYTLFDCAK